MPHRSGCDWADGTCPPAGRYSGMSSHPPPANNPDPVVTPQVIDPSEAPSPANNPNPDAAEPADPAPDSIVPPPAPGQSPRIV